MGHSFVALRLVHLEPRSHHRYHRMEGDLIKYIWFFQRMRLGGVTVTAICTSRHLLRNHAFITISSQASESLFLPPKMPLVACCTVPILVRGKSAMMTPYNYVKGMLANSIETRTTQRAEGWWRTGAFASDYWGGVEKAIIRRWPGSPDRLPVIKDDGGPVPAVNTSSC